jgi:hypothetical protein
MVLLPLSPRLGRTPLGQCTIGGSDHFPPLTKPSRNILGRDRRDSTRHIASQARPQDGLKGLLYFW